MRYVAVKANERDINYLKKQLTKISLRINVLNVNYTCKYVSWSVGSDWMAYYLHLNSQPSKEDKKANDDDKEDDDDDFDLFGSDEEEEDEEVCQKINKTFHV